MIAAFATMGHLLVISPMTDEGNGHLAVFTNRVITGNGGSVIDFF